MQIAALGERDQPVGDAAELLGLGQCGCDLLVLEQRDGEAREQRAAMRRGAVELTAGITMAHVT